MDFTSRQSVKKNSQYCLSLQYLQKGLWLVLSILLTACSSIRSIDVQIARLPKYPISDDIQSLVLINRSSNLAMTNLTSDSLEKILVDHKMSLDTVFVDSLASDTLLKVAAQTLFESGRFDIVVPKDPMIVRKTFNQLSKPLPESQISSICSSFNVDGALVLERFEEKIATEYTIGEMYEATTDLTYQSDWRLYRPGNQQLPLRLSINDSIYWKSNSILLKILYSEMPSTKQVLIEGGIASALKLRELIATNWENQKRYYYVTGQPAIDKAIFLIKENKWDEAAAIWEKYQNTNSKTLKSHLEYNLALAAEMIDNLDRALQWIKQSLESKYSRQAEVYLNHLNVSRQKKNKEPNKRF